MDSFFINRIAMNYDGKPDCVEISGSYISLEEAEEVLDNILEKYDNTICIWIEHWKDNVSFGIPLHVTIYEYGALKKASYTRFENY